MCIILFCLCVNASCIVEGTSVNSVILFLFMREMVYKNELQQNFSFLFYFREFPE